MSIKFKLIFFISLLFIIALSNAIFTFQLESYGEEKLKWINHTHKVIMETEHFLSHIQDAETGQRGYLLTEDISYLEPYSRGITRAINHFELLKKLTSDNPEQQKRLEVITKYMKLKFDELAQTIKLTKMKSNHNTKALEIVKQNKGKEYMDNIRKYIDKFVNEEKLLLEKRKGDFREHKARITTFIMIEVIFFVFLAASTISFLNKTLFIPLEVLLSSTIKMEKGERVEISDITSDDEMGFLLSSFYKMHQKVYTRAEDLEHKAHHDELTGLKNRTKMFHEIQNVIEELKEFNIKFAVLFIDLNKFKELNDTLGHSAGDMMLKETASRLKDSVGPDNSVFRLGGDEFLVLIKNVSEPSAVQNILSNILEAVKSPVNIQGQAVEISLSIGIAISPDDTRSSDEILKYSDIAMYAAKRDKELDYKFFDRSMLKRADDF